METVILLGAEQVQVATRHFAEAVNHLAAVVANLEAEHCRHEQALEVLLIRFEQAVGHM